MKLPVSWLSVVGTEDALLRLVTAVSAGIDDEWATTNRAYLAMQTDNG